MIHRTAQTPSVLALFGAAAQPAAATRPATPGATILRRCTLGLVQAAALVAVGLVALPAQAQAPLPYQGRLDRDGKPQNGFFDLRFSIFTTSTGGTAVVRTQPARTSGRGRVLGSARGDAAHW